MNSLALVRGKFLNQYEMQSFAPLVDRYTITAFGSLTPYHDTFPFPVVKLPSPMDIPEIPGKMSMLNRLCVDAHYLWGLEDRLKGFDIVHTAETYYHYTQQCLNARNKGYVKKVVATVLENIPHNNEGIWGRKTFKERSRNELDHMIALTQLTRTALIKEGADPDRITVIGHGIDTKRFLPTNDHWQRLARKNPDHLTILFSGRLEEYKGVMDILSAIPILLKDASLPPFQVVFVGEGSAKKSMQKESQRLGITSLVSFATLSYEAMPEIYANADIFVAPSTSTKTWKEQYCTALLEAQSMGLPIVATQSGGIPENVGDAGVLVPEHAHRKLAEALRAYMTSPALRLRYGKKARKRAEDVHDVHHIADRLDEVYRHILDISVK